MSFRLRGLHSANPEVERKKRKGWMVITGYKKEEQHHRIIIQLFFLGPSIWGAGAL
jgi:hypothetical protein